MNGAESYFIATEDLHPEGTAVVGAHTRDGEFSVEIALPKHQAIQIANMLSRASEIDWYATPKGFGKEMKKP